VSVVIAFLNGRNFLAEAIESVFSQTFSNWELLLVDDGSTDTSTETAIRCAERNPGRVRYFEHPDHQNLGVCASRNLAIRNAAGESVAILDADDVWMPRKLEEQAAVLRHHPEVAAVFGASQYWRSWTGEVGESASDYVPEIGVPSNSVIGPPHSLLLFYPLGTASAPCPSDILIRRDALQRIGGFEQEFTGVYQLYEDQAFLAKLYLSAPVFISGECWTRYRLHQQSCCASVAQAGQKDAARLFFLNWLGQYLRSHGIEDPHIWRAYHRAMRPYRRRMLSRFHPNHFLLRVRDLFK
jgi:glycosyltransferase involved in cell wall biosynthesis